MASEPSVPILVIDDNPVNVKLARAVLARAGYEVTTAGDGQTALASIAHRMPALIITDLMLPDLTGFDLAVRLKQDDRYCRIPIIAMTASGIANDAERAKAAGCDAFMLKPFEMDALLTLVAKLLNELPESR
ncbi:MAG: response regulator [Kofleriaceae bacterium]